MTSPPVVPSVEHWSFQVDSPFRGPAEIRELAGRSRPVSADAGSAEGEDVLGEGLAQAEEEFEAYDEYEPGSEADAYDEAEFAEASLLEEAPASEHPLAAVFSLPRLAFDAMAKGGWGTAIAVAIGAGLRDVNQLTNMVFWFRHPQLIGQKLRADQRDLAREWLQIRDQVVKPALGGGVPTTPTAPGGPPAHAPTATVIGNRTSIPSDGLRWFGPGEETHELMAFMRKVYDLHVKRSKGDFVDTLPDTALAEVVPGQRARKDAAAKAREMLAAARAALAAEGLTGTVRIGVLSGYRSADHQFAIWQGKTTNGAGGFPHYYAKTKKTRQSSKFGGEHSDKAAAYLAEYMAKCVAAPGFSNHQDGLALDLGTRKGEGRLIKLYGGSWFHNWMTANASTYQFNPLPSEAWHWTYRPTPGGSESEAWSSEVTPPAVPAGRLEVPRIPLLASHSGRAPDLILRWNDMPTVPAELDVVVHLHGYASATMTLPKRIEVWAGLDLGPVDGTSGTGRTRPTLTVLPRGHFTGDQVGKIYRYTFPALTTKDGLTTLVRVALEHFSERVGGSPPKVDRLILTAHSGGGAPLMQILRRHDPQEVHVFDGLYQDATSLVDWASRHIKADRLAVQGGVAPMSALRVFFGPTTKRFSQRLHQALAADLQDAPASIHDRYRVESSRLGHWQIARQYGWRMLSDPAADVPDAEPLASPKDSVYRLFEVDAAEMPLQSGAPFFPEAVEATETDEADAWELGESDTEGEAEFDAEGAYEEPPTAPELEEAETEARAFESEYGATDPEFEVSEAAGDVVLGAHEAKGAFEEQEDEDLPPLDLDLDASVLGWTNLLRLAPDSVRRSIEARLSSGREKWLGANRPMRRRFPNEPATNLDGLPIPPWVDVKAVFDHLRRHYDGQHAALTTADQTRKCSRTPTEILGANLTTPVTANYFVLHDTAGTRDHTSASKNGGVHLWIGTVSLARGADWDQAGEATKLETGNRSCFVHVELTRATDSSITTAAANTYRKAGISTARSAGTRYTDQQYDDLANAYIVASVRRGRFLTVTAHKEIDRSAGLRRDPTQRGHDDPEDLDVERLYRLISRKLALPVDTTFGIGQQRIDSRNLAGHANSFIEYARGNAAAADQYAWPIPWQHQNPSLPQGDSTDPPYKSPHLYVMPLRDAANHPVLKCGNGNWEQGPPP
jgi:hypothetical protein